MQFTPKSREALAESSLIPKGTYDFECVKGEEKRSGKGNDMFVLDLKIWLEDGSVRFLTDWILPEFDMGLAKLLAFCDAAGMSELYDAGDLNATDCVGKAGKVVVSQKKDKDSGELRNKVVDYKRAGAEQVTPKRAESKPGEMATEADDDIPF
jgi:hypothetical protein